MFWWPFGKWSFLACVRVKKDLISISPLNILPSYQLLIHECDRRVCWIPYVPHQPRRVLYRVVFPSLFNRGNIQTGSRERWSKLFFFLFLRQKGVKLMHLCGTRLVSPLKTTTNVLQTLTSWVKGWVQTSQEEPKEGFGGWTAGNPC